MRDFATNTSVAIPDSSILDITGTALTMHAWMHADDVTTESYFWSKHVRNSGQGYFMGVYQGSLNVWLGHNFHQSLAVSTGVMYSIGARRNGTGAAASHIFINGTKSSDRSDTTAIAAGAGTLTMGALQQGDTHFNGRVGEGAVWDVALTDDEMIALSKGFSALLVRPQSLVAYLPCWGKASPEPELIHGASGVVTNAPAASAHPKIIMPRSAIYLPTR